MKNAHTIKNISFLSTGAVDASSQPIITKARTALAGIDKRTKVFLLYWAISSALFIYLAFIAHQANNAPHDVVITSWTIIIAQAVSLLVNVIFGTLYVAALVSDKATTKGFLCK